MELAMKNKNKGFTLIEMIVALGVFSLVVITMTIIAGSAIKSQRKAFSLQNSQESTRFLLESISKELRMSVINSEAGIGLDTLNITNSRDETFDYQFDSENKRVLRGGQPLSPENLEITGSFNLEKQSYPNRSLVTIMLKAESESSRPEQQAEMYLQASICPRTNQ